MSINIRQDHSYLFSSFGTSQAGAGSSNFLADYYSIKNGSYYKLMKAYYSEAPNKSVKSIVNNSTSKDNSATLTKLQNSTDSLKDSADKLLKTGKGSIFNKIEKTIKDEDGVESKIQDYDVDAIYKAVSKFVEDYNSVVGAGEDSKTKSVQNLTNSMIGQTNAYKKSLSSIGITVKSDNTLSINEETFRKANMDSVKNLFNETGSYGFRVSAQASMINLAADREASKAATYNANGGFSNGFNSGGIFNGFF